MGKTFTVDSNFFNPHLLQSPETQEKLLEITKLKQLSFYPSLELIGELFAVYTSNNEQYLKRYASLFLALMDKEILNSWDDIIFTELSNCNSNIFLPEEITNKFTNIICKLSYLKKLTQIEEEFVLQVIDIPKKGKQKFAKKYKEANEGYKKIMNNNKFNSFDEFYKYICVALRKGIAKKMFLGHSMPVTEKMVDDIVCDFEKRAFFNLYSKVHAAFFYHQNIMNRGVEKGDFYDQFYLVYLAGIDCLITNEDRMIDLSRYIFKRQDKVLKFRGFFSM